MPYFQTNDGLKLHFTDTGPAPGTPILALPGLTRTGADFDYIAPHLDGRRLLTLTMRGRGASDHDTDWRNYNFQVECADIIAFLDHLNLEQAAILGTSRGGLQAMMLAVTHKDRLAGVALNDIGPEMDPAGLSAITGYLGRNPRAQTHEEAAAILRDNLPGFANIPDSRWLAEARLHYRQTGEGLEITYDPALRDAVLQGGEVPDLWPLFDALNGLPLCALRGDGSNLLSPATFDAMQARRPDMIAATIPDRGHVPFLDEPEALAALKIWQERLP
jgi:pimeloyl-ACP methyl ester carboxylesterase